MVWQNFVAAACTALFTYALIPQVVQGFKKRKSTVEFQTSLITFVCLFILGATMFTLGLYYTAIMNLLAGTLWMILFIQRCIYK